MSCRSMAAILKSSQRNHPIAVRRWLLMVFLGALSAVPAEAHFQLLYTPEAALQESAQVPLALVFSHPFNNGYTMDMGKPEAFYVISQRGAEAERRKIGRAHV